jgi:hypothetical protein
MAPKQLQGKKGLPAHRTIKVTVVQSGIAPPFSIVEKTTWKEATWSNTDDSNHTLDLKGDDASGMLRFMSPADLSANRDPEFFWVALGIDEASNGRWCDLKVDADAKETCASIHRNYDEKGLDEYKTRNKHKKGESITSTQNTVITVDYYGDPEDDEAKVRGVYITIT